LTLLSFLQQTVNGLSLGAMYALIALGYTMVYGILRLINFAHGDVFMVGAFVSYFTLTALQDHGWYPSLRTALVALAVAMLCAGMLGAVIERFAYKPLRSAPRIASLITAIGVSFLLENLGVVMVGPTPRAFPPVLTSRVVTGFGRNAETGVYAVPIDNQQMMLLIVSLLLMFVLHVVVQHTQLGRAMRAVSFDADAARLMGIDVDAIISRTFVVGSMLAAAAGLMYGMMYPKVEPYMGIMPGLKAFVAAVLGGIGNIPGAMLGGFLMGLAETYIAGVPSLSTYKDAAAFAILIGILLVRPAGLMGKGLVEKV
jgi:branched-chain amino acid transport system permease protein